MVITVALRLLIAIAVDRIERLIYKAITLPGSESFFKLEESHQSLLDPGRRCHRPEGGADSSPHRLTNAIEVSGP